MQKQTILIGAVVLLIGGVSGYALQAITAQQNNSMPQHMMDEEVMDEHHDNDGHHHDHSHEHDEHSQEHTMDMTVSSEREFLAGMIPHHQEAIDTAQAVLARGGTTPEIRTLAENIITAQEQEIAMMRGWYEEWYGEPYIETATYTPMMRDLSTLSGAELDRVFLEDMVMHHMGAIMMAQSVEPYIEHEEITQLRAAILETQTAEKEQMRRILNESFPL